jgi:hypothetical protein
MKSFAILAALSGLLVAAHAPAKDSAKPELTCSACYTPEAEAEKQIRHIVDGKEHIEYCAMGKKQVMIDSGDNG